MTINMDALAGYIYMSILILACFTFLTFAPPFGMEHGKMKKNRNIAELVFAVSIILLYVIAIGGMLWFGT